MSYVETRKIKNILEPYRVEHKKLENNKGLFVVDPLEIGYGVTIGNAMRRVALSSIEGVAVSCIQIPGVAHRFSGVDFLKEDIIELIGNLKNLRFKYSDDHPVLIRLNVNSKGEIWSKDLMLPTFVECVSANSYICEVVKEVDVEIFFLLKKGRGYMMPDLNDHNFFPSPTGCIEFANNYAAIKNISFSVDKYINADGLDAEKIIFNLETDGSILTDEAMKQSAKILCSQFSKICGGIEFAVSNSFIQEDKKEKEVDSALYRLLTQSIDGIEISARSYNCLKSAEINDIYSLVVKTEENLLGLTNFGRKSLHEIKSTLKSISNGVLRIGMYVPDNLRQMVEDNLSDKKDGVIGNENNKMFTAESKADIAVDADVSADKGELIGKEGT